MLLECTLGGVIFFGINVRTYGRNLLFNSFCVILLVAVGIHYFRLRDFVSYYR